jgi:hypothetical protein
MPRIILHPATVARLVLALTPAEDDELAKIVDAVGDDELAKCERVSEYLLKRFPQAAISIRRSAAASTN